MNQSSITNREALRDKIHEIHNYLRNNGAGYGMNALKVFNIIYGLKKIEEYNLYKKLGIDNEKCKFNYLLELANKQNDEELVSLVLGDVLDYFYDNKKLRKFLYYEIPRDIKGKVITHIVKEIDNLSNIEKSCNVQLSGKIYEYFIGRDESAISELGAYFTDRHIVNYIYNKLNVEINEDGSIPSMIDMFGGSGGFTTGYINYLKEHHKNIDWSKEISKVHHYDMNEDVIKSAGLEFLCLTGELPSESSLNHKNSFNDEFLGKKFEYIITNPPYGGDKAKQSEAQSKQSKIKDYITEILKTETDQVKREKLTSQLKDIKIKEENDKKAIELSKVCLKSCSQRIREYAETNKLKGNDKEACSLILMMDLLETNGTAVGVLKEGVFFNKAYKDLRTCLIKNFNVREVISIPQDQFENTSTKTSIVIFDNTETKTSNVKFYDLVVEKYEEDKFEITENGDVILLENKDDIKNVYEKLVSEATADEILINSSASLNSKDYSKKELKVSENYKLVKLEDICEFLPKSKRPASFGSDIGTYNFYTSSDKVKKCDIADYNQECILIGTGGNSCIHYIKNNFSCSADSLLLYSKIIKNEYIYYSIKSIWKNLTDSMMGSTIKHVTKDMLNLFKIPIPKTQEKLDYWVNKISSVYEKINEGETRLKQCEDYVSHRINEICEKEECDEVELGSICEVQDGFEFKDTDLNTDINDIPLIRATYINNKVITNYIKEDSKFNKYIINKGDIIFSQVGNVGSICKYQENRIGYNKRNAFRLRGINFNQNCLYYYLLSEDFKSKLFSNGSIVKFIKIPELRDIKIKIPKNKQFITDLEPYFNTIEQLQEFIKTCDTLYKQYIQELADDVIIKA